MFFFFDFSGVDDGIVISSLYYSRVLFPRLFPLPTIMAAFFSCMPYVEPFNLLAHDLWSVVLDG